MFIRTLTLLTVLHTCLLAGEPGRDEPSGTEGPIAGVPAQPARALGEPVNRALLIAVQDYDAKLGWTPLDGPVRDAAAMRDALVERGGFRPEHITTLFDQQATRAGVLAALDALADEARPDDLLLVFFAGHGSRLPDDDGDELDEWDETLVPVDPVAPDGSCNDIRDDDLQAFIERANKKTDNVVFLFDCCSSGTNVRGAGQQRTSRFVSPAQRGLESRGFAGVRSVERLRTAPIPDASDYFPPQTSYVALSACRSTQSAYETRVETPDGPTTHGIFTWSVIQELFALTPETSYGDLLERVRRRVAANEPGQTPVIEGRLSRRVLFGGRSVVQEPYLELRRTGGQWELSGGALVGVAVGTELPVGDERAATDSDARRVGRVVVDAVGPLRSLVHWTDGPHKTEGTGEVYRAFLTSRADAFGVCIVGGDLAQRSALISSLSRERAVRVVQDDAADLLASLGDDDTWIISRPDGAVLPISARASHGGDVEQLARDVSALARAHLLSRSFEQAGADVPATWQLLRVVDDGSPETLWSSNLAGAGDTPVSSADIVAVRVTNGSDKPAWATLLAIAPDGEVMQVWRTPEDEPLPPGRSRDTARFRLTTSPGAEAFYRGQPQRFVGLMTQRPVDLGAFEQPPVTNGPKTRGGSLGAAHKPKGPSVLLDEAVGVTCFGTRLDLP